MNIPILVPLRRFTLLCLVLAPAAAAEDWSMYLHDVAHSSVNTSESKLGVGNVRGLAQRWRLSLGNLVSAAPTVVNGVMYFGDWDGYFYAVSASDGRILWKQYVGKSAEPDAAYCMPATGVSSQAVVADKTVYVGGGDSAVYALDIRSGNVNWRVALADPNTGAYLWSSIMLSGKSLYLGIASLADCPLARGALVRIDLVHPAQAAILYLSSDDDPGSGVWSTPAIDTATNTVFITTGTGAQDPEAGAWGEAFIALDATTLDIKSYFLLPTFVPDADIEWGSSPTLFTSPDGTPLVGATGKDGILYALYRDDLSLAWTAKLAVGCISPEQGCGSLSTPAFDGSLLYVGAGDPDPDGFDNGSVYALDPSTGQTVWMRGVAQPVIAPVTLANGVLYVSSGSGGLAYNAQTGEQLWDDGGLGTLYSQPVIVDGVLYTTYFSGDVIAWTVPASAARSRPDDR